MKALVLAAMLVLSPVQSDDPRPGMVYEMCALTFNDGVTRGTTEEPCADVSPQNGIQLKGVLNEPILQECSQRPESTLSENLCFRVLKGYKHSKYYELHER